MVLIFYPFRYDGFFGGLDGPGGVTGSSFGVCFVTSSYLSPFLSFLKHGCV